MRFRIETLRSSLALAVLLILPLPLPAQLVEEFYAATGGDFGESPLVSGELVVWLEYGATTFEDRLHCRDIRLRDGPVVPLDWRVRTSFSILHGGFLFSGGLVRKLGPGCSLSEIVAVLPGGAIAASSRYLFARTSPPLRIVAWPLDRLHDRSSVIEVSELREITHLIRTEAASDGYFVWQDRDSPTDPWGIRVMDISEGIPGPVRVIATDVRSSSGVYLDVAGSYLVYQDTNPSLERRSRGHALYFVDLASGEEPAPFVTSEDANVWFDWPSISTDYVVWNETTGFFEREAFAMRIVDGRPSGEAFSLGPGGSWIRLDRNLTVANGGTQFPDNTPNHTAIVVRELDLPGAPDVGDANSDGAIDVTDAVVILRHLFAGGPRPRLRLADSDLDRRLAVTDAIVLLQYLFLAGERPGAVSG